MSQQHDERNRFVLFNNERKESDKHPDYTGKFTDEQGREYFMDAWIKRSGNGRTFMSGKIKPKQGQRQQQQQQRQQSSSDIDF